MLNKKKKNKTQQEEVKKEIAGKVTAKDVIAPSVVRETAFSVQIGDPVSQTRNHRTFYLNIANPVTSAGILDPLYNLDYGEADCDIALHVMPADTRKIVWQIEREIARLESACAEEPNLARRQSLLNQIAELNRRHSSLSSGVEKMFHAVAQVSASSPSLDEVNQFFGLLTHRLGAKNILLKAADLRQLDALLNSTPLGPGLPGDVWQSLESSNIADLFPFGIGGLRHKTGVVIGHDLIRKNLIFYDSWHPGLGNMNIVVFGRSGAGKSFLVKLLTARSALAGIQSVIIDPEREYENLAAGLGCPFISLSAESGDRLNIFDVEIIEEDNTRRIDLEEAIEGVRAAIFKMIEVYDPALLTAQVKVAILEKIKNLYTKFGITEDPRSLFEVSRGDTDVISLTGTKKKMPQLSDLLELMKTDPALADVCKVLSTFTKQGGTASSSIFDCQTTVEDIWDFPIIVFSVAGLDEEIMRPLGLFITTRWVWNKLSRNKRIKKRIVVDEAQVMMDTHETALWLENAFRRARKRNISMCACTQGFEVFMRVPEGNGILKNATTKIMMKQEPIDITSVTRDFGLSQGEADFLLTAKIGTGIIKTDKDAAVFYAVSTDKEYRMFTSDPNDLVFLEEDKK